MEEEFSEASCAAARPPRGETAFHGPLAEHIKAIRDDSEK